MTPTTHLHSKLTKPHLISKMKKYTFMTTTHSGNKHSHLSSLSIDHLKAKSTSSKRNNRNKMRKNFSGVIGQVSQDSDELLTKINTDLFVRNSVLPLSVLFSFHQLFDNKFTLLKFLSKTELLKFSLINKSYGRIFLNEFMVQIENEMNSIEIEIQKGMIRNNAVTHKLASPHFNFSNKAIKAAELLNEDSYLEIFKQKKPPNDNVLFIYYLLFNMFNLSNTICKIIQSYDHKHISGYWNILTSYLQSKTNSRFGSFIMSKLNHFDYLQEHLDKIYQIASVNYHLINPSHYTKVCPTTALVTFIVKDFLDYCNISNDLIILKEKQVKYIGLFQRMVTIKQIIYNTK